MQENQQNLEGDQLRQKFVELGKLKNVFGKENLSLGFSIWLFLIPIWLAYSLTALVNLQPGIEFVLTWTATIISFIMLSKIVRKKAEQRYRLKLFGSCWWSVAWRAAAFAIVFYWVPVFVMTWLINPTYIKTLAKSSDFTSDLFLSILGIFPGIVAYGWAAMNTFRMTIDKRAKMISENQDLVDEMQEEKNSVQIDPNPEKHDKIEQ